MKNELLKLKLEKIEQELYQWIKDNCEQNSFFAVVNKYPLTSPNGDDKKIIIHTGYSSIYFSEIEKLYLIIGGEELYMIYDSINREILIEFF